MLRPAYGLPAGWQRTTARDAALVGPVLCDACVTKTTSVSTRRGGVKPDAALKKLEDRLRGLPRADADQAHGLAPELTYGAREALRPTFSRWCASRGCGSTDQYLEAASWRVG